MSEYVVKCESCGILERGDLEDVGDAAEDHEQFHDVAIQRVATDGGCRSGAAGGPATPPSDFAPPRRGESVRQLAGVGDQDGMCWHTEGPLPCFDCLLEGGDS